MIDDLGNFMGGVTKVSENFKDENVFTELLGGWLIKKHAFLDDSRTPANGCL